MQPQPVADHSGVATGQLDGQEGSSSPVHLSPPSNYLALSICSLFWCFVIGIFAVISAIILKLQVEKIDIKGFSTVLVSTGTPGSDNKMLTESTIGIYIKSKMAAKSHNTPC